MQEVVDVLCYEFILFIYICVNIRSIQIIIVLHLFKSFILTTQIRTIQIFCPFGHAMLAYGILNRMLIFVAMLVIAYFPVYARLRYTFMLQRTLFLMFVYVSVQKRQYSSTKICWLLIIDRIISLADSPTSYSVASNKFTMHLTVSTSLIV